MGYEMLTNSSERVVILASLWFTDFYEMALFGIRYGMSFSNEQGRYNIAPDVRNDCAPILMWKLIRVTFHLSKLLIQQP